MKRTMSLDRGAHEYSNQEQGRPLSTVTYHISQCVVLRRQLGASNEAFWRMVPIPF